MEIKIVLNGAEQTVTKDQLFDLAANGTIRPDTNISIDGQLIPAVRVKGLVFGKSTNNQTPASSPLPNSVQNDFPPPFDNIQGNNPFAEFSQQNPQQVYVGNFPSAQPYPQYNQYPAQAGSGKAIASLVCGILSMVLCGGFLILPVIGLILGILGSKSKNQGLAIAGIVLCAFSFFLFFINLALFLPAVQAAREAARRMQCSNNEKQIALAFHNFHDSYNAFPALYTVDENGQPLHSWRVLILPFLGETELYEKIRLNEPWDSEYNRQFHPQTPSVYVCPSNRSKTTDPDQCCYSAIAGKGWNKDKTLQDKEGILTPAEKAELQVGTTIRSVADGLSSTLLIIEVKEPFCWMNPLADKTFNDLEKIGTEHSSFHAGGFNGALGDASVRFISNTIAPNILNALGTRDGGESVSLP